MTNNYSYIICGNYADPPVPPIKTNKQTKQYKTKQNKNMCSWLRVKFLIGKLVKQHCSNLLTHSSQDHYYTVQ